MQSSNFLHDTFSTKTSFFSLMRECLYHQPVADQGMQNRSNFLLSIFTLPVYVRHTN